jgi:formamidopyrimidine-DNA glycosylase
MLELPEATVVAGQINQTLTGKKIQKVIAASAPHKFAWFAGDPQAYPGLLVGKTIGTATGYGGLVEIKAEDVTMVFGDGVTLKYHAKTEPWPSKHQLLVEFEDATAFSGSVQMYGGLWCFKEGTFTNPYHAQAREKPSPLTAAFDKTYFESLIINPELQKLSLKALLATEQRIPGLGNGVLQDILFNAKMHPKKKINSLSESDKDVLFNSIKSTLSAMVAQGGRDTEKDFLGNPGVYITILSKNTVDKLCGICGTVIRKEAYLGGSIYYCGTCQKL